jgi:hypothetical protein
VTTYIEALAPYTQPQQMKLAFLVLRKLNAYRGDHFNAIAEACVDGWDEPHTTEEIIEAAHEIWASAHLGGGWFTGSDQAIDLQPLVKWMKRNGVWVDRPKGWSNAA